MQKTKLIKNKKGMKLETRNTLIGLSFIAPNFIGFFIFILIPVVFSFLLSFAEWDGFNEIKFVGIKNFIRLTKDRVFMASLSQTFTYVIFTVIFTLIAALGLAVLLNQKLKGTNFFRSAVFFPHVASIVAVGVVWNAMFQPQYGPLNEFLRWLGMQNLPGWTASTKWAIPAVIIVSVWKDMGYFMLVYLAALQNVPNSLYEASTIDGASKWQQFWRITLPMITPAHFFVFMMLTINSFKIFSLILVMTEGGPGTSTTMLSYYIYNQSFVAWDFGKASAASMILFVIIATITIIQFRVEKKFNDFM
ncbi:MAG: sugar ABC transporter permease [Oscillospiraceae bacterium]|nr:sugar ABC transporter permease [Oscillospiraceae bacterium]